VPKHLGVEKLATLHEMCRGRSDCNARTELILLSVRTSVEFSEGARATKSKKKQIGVLWALWKVQNEAIPKIPLEGHKEEWKALKPRVKAANEPKWAQRSLESIWEYGGGMGVGAGKRVIKWEMCTENDRGVERQSQ
jgi:hypothetical protein